MSKELKHLIQLVKLKQFEKSPPKKALYHILDEIEDKLHYGRMRCWEILVEFLARWLVTNKETEILPTACYPVCLPFHGLPLKTNLELYRHIDNLDLFKQYYTAAKKRPWDYIGEVYMEQGLTGSGQNMTPRAIVELMLQMTLGDEKEIKEPQTVLDPCVGSGRFLICASLLYPKAPLILFGVEINPSLYHACLVNMATFSRHPYSIICADSLRLDPNLSGPTSKLWDLGNRWNMPDVSAFYQKPPPIREDAFSLKAFTKGEKTGRNDKNV